MRCLRHRAGFTLLEMLVASLLFGMLVTLLTVLFNQGNRAWDVGRVAAVNLDRRRQAVAENARLAADYLPTDAGGYRVLSAWDEQGNLRTTRPLEKASGWTPQAGTAVAEVQLVGAAPQSARAVVVRVASAGPDGRWGTDDDIATGPVEDFE